MDFRMIRDPRMREKMIDDMLEELMVDKLD